jgi:hypothetical protein
MSNPFTFDSKPRSGALAEAAERLDRVAAVVKDQQLARTQSGRRKPESEAYVSSPEEAWSKKYMIQCVGPVCTIRPTEEGALLLPRFQPAPQAEAKPQTVAIAPASAPAAKAKASAKPEPIGALIGKPARRSFLGRMFGR